MSADAAELLCELKALRKGRGLMVARIDERVGPALRRACGMLDTDNSAEVRRKITNALTSWTANLPDDLQIAVVAAFGLHPGARQTFYQDRVRWAADQLCRDERTARRRVDAGLDALAELAANRPAALAPLTVQQAGWQTVGLWITLSLDLPSPEAFEYRRIIAYEDGVDELDLSITLTANEADPTTYRELELDVFRGGKLVRWARKSDDRFAFALALPRPLIRGQMHDYAIRLRVPGDQIMQPHYICVPRHCYEVFDLNVRFDAIRPPRRVWTLSEALRQDVEGPPPQRQTTPVDSAGEVHINFQRLIPGMAYGIRWEEAVFQPATAQTDALPELSTPALNSPRQLEPG
jgi:hypothetical protein